jgi:hypothetical protein
MSGGQATTAAAEAEGAGGDDADADGAADGCAGRGAVDPSLAAAVVAEGVLEIAVAGASVLPHASRSTQNAERRDDLTRGSRSLTTRPRDPQR